MLGHWLIQKLDLKSLSKRSLFTVMETHSKWGFLKLQKSSSGLESTYSDKSVVVCLKVPNDNENLKECLCCPTMQWIKCYTYSVALMLGSMCRQLMWLTGCATSLSHVGVCEPCGRNETKRRWSSDSADTK